MATREADFEATTSRVRRMHARMCALNRRYRDERLAVPRRFRVRWLLGLVVYVPFLQFTLRVAGLYLPDWWDGVATLGFALVVVLGWCLLLSLFPARRRDSEQRDLKGWQAVLGYLWCILIFVALVALWGRVESWYTPDPPFAPTGLVLAAGDESLDVSWDASPSKDTFEFGYELRWKRSVQSWKDTNKKKLSDSTTSYRITGLTNNTAYDVTIEAYNLGGTSSEVTATATPAAAP